MEKKCIKISNIKISPDKNTAFLEGIIKKELRLGKDAQIDYEIAKRSLDCRHKPQVMYIYSVEVYKVVRSGKEEKLENFEQVYEETAGEDAFFQAANLVEAKSVAVKTPDVTIKVSPQRMDLVQIQLVEGRRCIVIPMEDGVQINGMNVTMEGTNGTD